MNRFHQARQVDVPQEFNHRAWAHLSICAAVVAQRYSTSLQSKTLEVMGLNPAAGCWAFFFSTLSCQQCILNSGPSQRCNTTDFPIKICLAVQLEANQA